MPQNDLDVAREAVQRFSRGDLDGLAATFTPDAVLWSPEGWPESGPFEGRDAVVRQFGRVTEDWESYDMETGREASFGEWGVLELIWRARGRASGAELEMRLCGAALMRDHRIAELHLFWNYEDALAKAGLDT